MSTAVRELTNHKVNGLNDAIKIEVMDGPGPGGANHLYQLSVLTKDGTHKYCFINFQNGPIQEAGFNGFSQEALLAVLEDRLVGFQNGPYANDDNEEALDYIRKAMKALHRRTKERMARGVEGTMQK